MDNLPPSGSQAVFLHERETEITLHWSIVAVGSCSELSFEVKVIPGFPFQGDEFKLFFWDLCHNPKEIFLSVIFIFWQWKLQAMFVSWVINPVWCFVLLMWCKTAAMLCGLRLTLLDGNGTTWGKAGLSHIVYKPDSRCLLSTAYFPVLQLFPTESIC